MPALTEDEVRAEKTAERRVALVECVRELAAERVAAVASKAAADDVLRMVGQAVGERREERGGARGSKGARLGERK